MKQAQTQEGFFIFPSSATITPCSSCFWNHQPAKTDKHINSQIYGFGICLCSLNYHQLAAFRRSLHPILFVAIFLCNNPHLSYLPPLSSASLHKIKSSYLLPSHMPDAKTACRQHISYYQHKSSEQLLLQVLATDLSPLQLKNLVDMRPQSGADNLGRQRQMSCYDTKGEGQGIGVLSPAYLLMKLVMQRCFCSFYGVSS